MNNQPRDKLLLRPSDSNIQQLPDHIGSQTFQLGIELGLSVVEMQKIESNHVTNLHGQTEEVLKRWIKIPEATFEALGKALHRLELSSVLSYLTYDEELGGQMEIEIDEHVRERIIQGIQISQILDYMMTHLVISSDDRRRIEHHAGQDDQNKALLREVIKRGEPTYTVFIDALRTSGYPDLANETKSDGQEEGSSAAIVQTGNIENKGAVVQNNIDIWFRRVLEVTEVQQKQQIWMLREGQPEDNVHDDYLFPMNSRLSFAGPRESEQDLTCHRDEFEFSPKHRPRLVRSSSDPSVNTMEKIPGIPPYPAPPSYRKPSSPTSPGEGMYDDRRYVDLDQSEDRYYPSNYANNMSPRHPSRAHIDAYATITPHERLRPSLPTDERWFDPAYDLKSAPDHRRTDSDPAHRSYQQFIHIPNDNKPFHDNASFSGDSYTRYTSHPANKHDDSKLREKFGTKNVRNTSHDPYRFTRSTAHPVNTASVDKSKLSDLTARYRKDEPNQKPRSLSTSRLPTSPQNPPSSIEQPQKKVPPPVPVKTYNLKERGIEPDELKMRNYENTNRSYNYNDGSAYATVNKPDRYHNDENPYDYVVPRSGYPRQQQTAPHRTSSKPLC
ncbi:tight junction protein 1 [Mytilus galloprovincialis]|uniref:Tight junction protein 1 n=1 Tax=Mytilus galloprovincialis TaxID=29158 RepID=A0A8B6C7Q0_MYTGA|nr:tight junction protein 1 [Mytilus galloprovincialis]